MSRYIRSYPYVDANGTPRFEKRRLRRPVGNRKFKTFSLVVSQVGQPVWVPGIREEHREFADRALYHLDEVYWALEEHDPVYWDEGEKDADAMRGRFGVVATSHHQGAANATIEQALTFVNGKPANRSKSLLYLVADNDLPGAACVLHRRNLLVEVGVDKSRITIVAPPPNHKGRKLNDAADMIAAGLGLDDFRELSPRDRRLLRAAERHERARRAGRRPGGYGRAP